MARTGFPLVSLSPKIQSFIQKELKSLGVQSPKEIARCIQKQSDYYIENPQGKTPWGEEWCQVAQVAYYLPLNWIRNAKVYAEASRFNFFTGLDHFVELGSGLGASSDHALKYLNQGLCVEQGVEAKEFHKKLHIQNIKWNSKLEVSSITDKTLGVFSYVLTEFSNPLTWVEDFSAVLIVEPSTHEDARKLMALRQQLIDKGYSIWAPCTHQQACPLLEKSQKDWCHDRVNWEMPEWFKEIEKHLPIKNQTVTLSYLLARKIPSPVQDKVRVVGDLLKEKGKTRIMVCRNEEREFLSALKKHKVPMDYHRGELIDLPLDYELKGNEIRLKL